MKEGLYRRVREEGEGGRMKEGLYRRVRESEGGLVSREGVEEGKGGRVGKGG